MTGIDTSVRRTQVKPPSARTELTNVVGVGLLIVVAVLALLAFDSAHFRQDAKSQRNLLPFQAMVQDRPSNEQRVFRELQEGLLEAELRRAANGTWPTVAALAADGIPPFAPNPTAKGGTYLWRLIQSGIFVNYLGIPQHSDGPAWLVLIEEPAPGAPPYPGPPGEEHHRLADGTMLRVSTWVHPDGGRMASDIIRIPQAGGWTQLYAVGPSVQ
jgi:hypothetical protein